MFVAWQGFLEGIEILAFGRLCYIASCGVPFPPNTPHGAMRDHSLNHPEPILVELAWPIG